MRDAERETVLLKGTRYGFDAPVKFMGAMAWEANLLTVDVGSR
jgi:hypothetical protein